MQYTHFYLMKTERQNEEVRPGPRPQIEQTLHFRPMTEAEAAQVAHHILRSRREQAHHQKLRAFVESLSDRGTRQHMFRGTHAEKGNLWTWDAKNQLKPVTFKGLAALRKKHAYVKPAKPEKPE